MNVGIDLLQKCHRAVAATEPIPLAMGRSEYKNDQITALTLGRSLPSLSRNPKSAVPRYGTGGPAPPYVPLSGPNTSSTTRSMWSCISFSALGPSPD